MKELTNRRERSTCLITLSVTGNSNPNAITNLLRKEYATSHNIKNKKTKKRVQKALSRLLSKISSMRIPNNGFLAYGAYDGI